MMNNEWEEEVKRMLDSEDYKILIPFITSLLASERAKMVEKMSYHTFLGNLYGVPIWAETRDEVILQEINKWLEEARMKMMNLTEV